MKYNLLIPTQTFLALSCVFALSSCEDKELIQKNNELLNHITELEEKVAVLEAKVGEDPGDQTANLKQANDNLTNALKKLQELDREKEQLEAQQVATEKEFRDYQSKYKIEN